MTELETQLQKLAATRPVAWENMPDIHMYMDQIISYMPRQLMDFESGETLTSAMVNNYIKAELMPRASEKRYERTHIAQLTAICMLKHVLSAKDLCRLFGTFDRECPPEAFYNQLTDALNRELNLALDGLTSEMDTAALRDAVLELAVGAYARQLVSLRLLDILCKAGQSPEADKTPSGKK